MSSRPWSKFFWNDWRGDPGVRASSLSARGLWIEMLCIAAEADPTGFVLVNGRIPSTTDLARMTGEPEAVVQTALEELDRNGVFSRDRSGRMYSRRMVRDSKIIATNTKNGKMGGNPSLSNIERKSGPVNRPDNPSVKAHIPEAREEDSEADASAPPGDPVKQLWARCLAIVGDRQRSLVGKMRKQYGDVALLEAVIETEAENPSDPVAYLIGCCKWRKENAGSRTHQGALDILARAAIDFDERQGGGGTVEAAH